MSGEINPNKGYISHNKYGLQKNDFAKNSVLQKIFDFFDINKDGEWDNGERKAFLGKFQEANNRDGHNSIFTGQEDFLKSAVDANGKSLFDEGLCKDDFNEFLKIYAKEYNKNYTESPHVQVIAVDFLNEKTESAAAIIRIIWRSGRRG